MRSGKQKMVKINKVAQPSTNNVKELYQFFEKKYGNESSDTSVSPREFGKQLASELIEKIDKEVSVK
jgi:hypothetical protein